MPPPVLSIDYGTSNTVAVMRRPDGQVRPLLFDSSPLLPSGVYARPADLVTGQEAARSAMSDPARFEPHPKRRIDDGEVLLGQRSIPVPELIAATLGRVRHEVIRVAGAIPARVIITHPAAWGSRRRTTLREAAELAGFHAVTLTPEPVAAARYFAAMQRVSVPPGGHVAVYDLGAGTFDASLVRLAGNGFEVVVADGLDDFGGVDLDELVIAHIGGTVKVTDASAWDRLMNPGDDTDRRGRFALRDAVRHAKEALSRGTSADLYVPLADRHLHLTRAEFDNVATSQVARTVELMAATIRRAGIAPAELSGVFLVGGSTRVPLVATLLHRQLGIPATVIDQPELVVAEGGLDADSVVDPIVTTPSLTPPLEASKPVPMTFPKQSLWTEIEADDLWDEPETDAGYPNDLEPTTDVDEERRRQDRLIADAGLPDVIGPKDGPDSVALKMLGVFVVIIVVIAFVAFAFANWPQSH